MTRGPPVGGTTAGGVTAGGVTAGGVTAGGVTVPSAVGGTGSAPGALCVGGLYPYCPRSILGEIVFPAASFCSRVRNSYAAAY